MSDLTVKCPICGCDYTHPIGVLTFPIGKAKTAVVVTDQGVKYWNNAEPLGRGVTIEVLFRCENLHIFTWRLNFCKGNTSFDIIPGSDKIAKGLEQYDTIWRD